MGQSAISVDIFLSLASIARFYHSLLSLASIEYIRRFNININININIYRYISITSFCRSLVSLASITRFFHSLLSLASIIRFYHSLLSLASITRFYLFRNIASNTNFCHINLVLWSTQKALQPTAIHKDILLYHSTIHNRAICCFRLLSYPS